MSIALSIEPINTDTLVAKGLMYNLLNKFGHV